MGESLKVSVGADGTAFEAGLNKISAGAKTWAGGFGNTFKGAFLGAFTGGAIASTILGTIQGIYHKAADLDDNSKIFRTSIERLQILEKAARRAGLELDSMTPVMNKISTLREKASSGDADATKTLAGYGITLADVNDESKDTVSMIEKIGHALKGTENDIHVGAKLLADYGKAGLRLGAVADELSSGKFKPSLSAGDVADAKAGEIKVGEIQSGAKNALIGFIGSIVNAARSGTSRPANMSREGLQSLDEIYRKEPAKSTLPGSVDQSDLSLVRERELTALGMNLNKIQVEKLGPLAKERELKREILNIETQIDELKTPGMTQEQLRELDTAEFEKKKKQLELANYQASMTQESGPYKVNSLQSQGAYVGGPRADTGLKQVTLLEKIVENTKPKPQTANDGPSINFE